MLAPHSYLKTVFFPQLDSWSVQSLLNSSVSYGNRFPLSKIGEFLTQSRHIVNVESEKSYKRITIRIKNGGVLLRDIEIGRNIGTKKQFQAKAGQFILSKIDARNGAFGIVPPDLDEAIVTNDFPLFDANTSKIIPEFLVLVTTTKEFAQFAQSCSSGTTNRQRMDIELFLNQKIPLPSLREQQAIVNLFNKKISQIVVLETEVHSLENKAKKYLLSQLGIAEVNADKNQTRFSTVKFTDLQRWDSPYLLGNFIASTSKYETATLSTLVTSVNRTPQGKSLRRDSFKFPREEFYYIGMEHVQKETGKLFDMPKVKGSEIKSQTILVPPGYFIYGKLRPYLNKYWRNTTNLENIICSSEFLVFDVKPGIDKLYFKQILSSPFIQAQIKDKTSGARMPRINEELFLSLKIPVPPVSIQKKIVQEISKISVEIDILEKRIQVLKKETQTDFENEIFG